MTPFEQPFQIFSGLPVTAFVTGRHGGVSHAPFDSLNLAYLTADERANVRANRELVAAALGLSHDELLIGRQVHGTNVNRATQVKLGETEGDAIVLTEDGTAAMVVVADCLPLLLYDPGTRVGAVAHAGWRGLAAGVLAATVETMEGVGARPTRILAGIGPGIGICCYEVGPEVISKIRPVAAEARRGDGDRWFLDLKLVARRSLLEAGLAGASIETMNVCTRCRSDLYFSARAGEPTGRFAAGLKLLAS